MNALITIALKEHSTYHWHLYNKSSGSEKGTANEQANNIFYTKNH